MLRLILLLVGLGAAVAYLFRIVERRHLERIAQARSRFLVATPAPRAYGPVFKDVTLRNGALSLRIPRHWSEEYPDDEHASFHDPGSPERVFRVSHAMVPQASAGLRSVLSAHASTTATTFDELATDRMLLKELAVSREESRDRLVFRWLLAVALSPTQARLATFTLGVPEQAVRDPLTWDVLAMIELEVRSSHLAPA